MSETRKLTEDAVRSIIVRYGNDPQQIIAVLLDIQAASGRNYVDKKWARLASDVMHVPLAQVYEMLTFYAMFHLEPQGEYFIEICQSAPCHFGGGEKTLRAGQVVEWFEAETGIKIGETTADGKITLARTSCVGACETGPAVKIGDDVYGNLSREKVAVLVKSCREGNLREANLKEAFPCQN